jgi:Spy/CpxP family protein refolding chaperone
MSILALGLVACGGSTAPAPPTTPTTTQDQTESPDVDQHRRNHGGVTMLIEWSIKDLDLTADQKAKVEKIRTDLHAKMAPTQEAAKNLANVLADGVAAGAMDKAKDDAAIAQVSTAAAGLHDATTDAMNQLHAALTPAQRAQLVDKLDAHFEKWKNAQGQDEDDAKPARPHGGGHMKMMKQLALTQDQMDKIKASFSSDMKAAHQTHEHKEFQAHRDSFATAFKAETFDAKSMTNESAASSHMAMWGATRMARFLEAATPVLTPEQRTKLAQMIRDRAGHMGD